MWYFVPLTLIVPPLGAGGASGAGGGDGGGTQYVKGLVGTLPVPVNFATSRPCMELAAL